MPASLFDPTTPLTLADKLIAKHLPLQIKRHGKALLLRLRSDAGTIDPATNLPSATVAWTNYSMKGFPFRFEQKLVDGETIMADDYQVIIPAVDTSNVLIPQPEPKRSALYLGPTTSQEGLMVLNSNPIFSGNRVGCYILHCGNRTGFMQWPV